MFVKECMTKKVELGTLTMSLSEAAQKMRDGDFGMLPIGEGDHLVGMITDRDIVVRAIAQGKDPKQVQVQEVMSKQVLYCYEDQTLEEIAKNLADNQIRRLPVLNRQKRLVGILSLGDIAQGKAVPDKIKEALQVISRSPKNSSDMYPRM